MRFVILLGLALISSSASACRRPPDVVFSPYQELLKWSKTVVLARVESVVFTPNVDDRHVGYTTYKLRTERILLGHPPSTFEFYDGFAVKGWELPNRQKTTFNNHKDPEFWAHGGRSLVSTNCEIENHFENGAMYLVFLDKPYHESGFEKIESDNDLWLKVVELSIESGL